MRLMVIAVNGSRLTKRRNINDLCGKSISGNEGETYAHNLAKVRVGRSNRLARSNSIKHLAMIPTLASFSK